MKKLPLSVVIIARNEAGLIGRAVASAGFAQEVLVVDAKSIDRTAEVARSLGARVVEREWTNFSDQRNFSLSQAGNEWVLVLDADEAITPALVQWLERFFSHPLPETGGWRIKRAEYFLGKRIHGACWNPSFQDRLFRKSQARYVGDIHEYPEVKGGWTNAPEEALLDHNPNVTIESFLEKMNRYTTVEAHDRFRGGQRTSIPHLAVVFFANWWKNFFYYKAYRDGAHGFVISLMEAVSRTVRHLKLWQIEEMHRQGRIDLLPDPTRSLNAGAALHRKLEAEDASR